MPACLAELSFHCCHAPTACLLQFYIINGAKVAFLNPRAQTKFGRPSAGDSSCRACHRQLREGYSFCSISCRVSASVTGMGSAGRCPGGLRMRACM